MNVLTGPEGLQAIVILQAKIKFPAVLMELQAPEVWTYIGL